MPSSNDPEREPSGSRAKDALLRRVGSRTVDFALPFFGTLFTVLALLTPLRYGPVVWPYLMVADVVTACLFGGAYLFLRRRALTLPQLNICLLYTSDAADE